MTKKMTLQIVELQIFFKNYIVVKITKLLILYNQNWQKYTLYYYLTKVKVPFFSVP